MAKLPDPDWVKLSESAERAAQAFGAELSAVKTALIDAFHDGKIRTRGRCHSFFGHNVLHDLASYTWDRADVVWQNNEFTIPDDRLGRERHTFSDAVVCREDLKMWINGGAMEIGQHLITKAVQSNKGGRPPKYDWDAFHREVIRLANLPDGLPETQAELERQMAEWCNIHWGVEPSEGVLKDKVRLIFQQVRADPSIS